MFYAGLLFLLLGISMLAGDLIYDTLKLGIFGPQDATRFGIMQMIMLIIGIVIMIVGIALAAIALRKAKKAGKEQPSQPAVLAPLPPGSYPYQASAMHPAMQPYPPAQHQQAPQAAFQPAPQLAPQPAPQPIHIHIEVPLPQVEEVPAPACPSCGKDIQYVEQYGRWYCGGCGQYAPAGFRP
jgi:hypothetical protein